VHLESPLLSFIGRRVLLFRKGLTYYSGGLYNKIILHDILFYAAGIAFNGLMCLVPFLLLTTSMLGTVLHSSTSAMSGLDEILSNLFPAQLYSPKLRQITTDIMRDVVVYRKSMGILGSVALLGTIAALFGSIRTVLHYIFDITKQPRLIIGQLRDWGLASIIGFLFLVMNGFTWLASFAMKSGFFMVRKGSIEYLILNTTLENVVSFVVTIMTVYVIFRFIPYVTPPRRVVRVSSLTTAILWEIAGRLFALYLVTFKPYSSVYGAYAFFAVSLFWIYLSSIIFVLGAMIGQLSYERVDLLRTKNSECIIRV
jgi:membrane protein